MRWRALRYSSPRNIPSDCSQPSAAASYSAADMRAPPPAGAGSPGEPTAWGDPKSITTPGPRPAGFACGAFAVGLGDDGCVTCEAVTCGCAACVPIVCDGTVPIADVPPTI